MPLRTIETEADVAAGLRSLIRRDPRLRAVARIAGKVPLRRRAGGMEGLARIILGQQLSVASAKAIWLRFVAAFPGIRPEAILAADEAVLRAPGLSGPKIRALRALAEAVAGGLVLDELATLPAEEAHARLTAVKGIGPWTADIYLLFCLGHPDIFPVGDLALRNAVADAFDLEMPASEKAIADIAAPWSPWRGVAAALFWAYYRARRQRTALPL